MDSYDYVKVNAFIINCLHNDGKVMHDFDFKKIISSRDQGNSLVRFFDHHSFDTLKHIYVSFVCKVGDTVRPHKIIVYNNIMYIIYSSQPLNDFTFIYVNEYTFAVCKQNVFLGLMNCFEDDPSTYGVVAYDDDSNPRLYFDGKDYIPHDFNE